jgi:tetratricopeptide (TPR) repeat protein
MPEKIEETPLRRICREVGDPGLFPPEVHRQYEAGKARKAQAVLRAHVSKELNSARKRRQQQYLDDTYLWLEPLGKAPTMHTINGIGSMLYGNYKPNADGVHIATLWFVFVFVPVFPLAAYVVRKADGNSWNFYAKAPLPPFARFWRLGVVAVTALVALAIGAQVAWDSAHAELWVYNGFEVPMEVTVADDHFTLRPKQVMKAGDYPLEVVPITATPQGWSMPIEDIQPDLDLQGDDELLYNIAGRASLVRGWVIYGDGTPPDDDLLGAPTFVPVGSVDYLLREPPTTKQVREGSRVTDELIYDAEDEVPFSVAAFFTQSMLGPEDAWRMTRARLAVLPSDRDAMMLANSLRGPGDPELVALAELARSGQPDNVEAHRFYQNSLDVEQSATAIEAYQALAVEHPESAMYQYLVGRLLDDGSPEAEALFRKALELEPEFAYAHLALGYLLAHRGELVPALEYYDHYAASGDVAFAEVMRSRLRLLQAAGIAGWQGRAHAILDQAEARLSPDIGPTSLRAVLHARAGSPPLEDVLELLEANLRGMLPDPAAVDGALVVAKLDVLMAAGDLAGARGVLDGLEIESDPWSLAKGDVFLALGSGDTQAIAAALDTHLDLLSAAPTSQTLYAAAVARALGHASAEPLLAAVAPLARPGSVSPAVVLEPGVDLGSPAALDGLLASVPFDARGLGYATAAVLLEHGAGDAATLRHAKAEATRLLLPDELPPWR